MTNEPIFRSLSSSLCTPTHSCSPSPPLSLLTTMMAMTSLHVLAALRPLQEEEEEEEEDCGRILLPPLCQNLYNEQKKKKKRRATLPISTTTGDVLYLFKLFLHLLLLHLLHLHLLLLHLLSHLLISVIFLVINRVLSTHTGRGKERRREQKKCRDELLTRYNKTERERRLFGSFILPYEKRKKSEKEEGGW
ncbi:hypothetical protein CSUI_006210 [Cystoisospora suis]|uniref:Transmembrane protein n=1 Tax=Cystoisospora suis TaxID=483139 RepID=A0A2C6KUB7_9APIC|nr:hypothetical protein CSUI_006210 [Cystoisospora suis]